MAASPPRLPGLAECDQLEELLAKLVPGEAAAAARKALTALRDVLRWCDDCQGPHDGDCPPATVEQADRCIADCQGSFCRLARRRRTLIRQLPVAARRDVERNLLFVEKTLGERYFAVPVMPEDATELSEPPSRKLALHEMLRCACAWCRFYRVEYQKAARRQFLRAKGKH